MRADYRAFSAIAAATSLWSPVLAVVQGQWLNLNCISYSRSFFRYNRVLLLFVDILPKAN